MAPNVLEADLAATLKDARNGLRAWWEALAGLRDNPLLSRLRQGWRARPPLLRLATGWAPLLLVLGALGYVIWRYFVDARLFARGGTPILGFLFLVGAAYASWLGMGLYHLAFDALALLSGGRRLGRGDLQLDETVMAARLTEREILAALLASLLPRLWLRWLSAPAVTLAGLWLYHGWLLRQERKGYEVGGWMYRLAVREMAHFAWLSPLAWLWLGLFALPVAVALLFWLIALGRSITIRWQMQLIALSVSLMQLAWIPLAVVEALNWQYHLSWDERQDWWLTVAWVFFPLAILAILVYGLYFSRRQPGFRLLLAAGAPALSLAIMALAVVLSTGNRMFLADGFWYIMLNCAACSLSGFALLNPLLLPYAEMLGAHSVLSNNFGWPRTLLLFVLQLIVLAICAHAARLAIRDWRTAED
jgi:hypothetical protein